MGGCEETEKRIKGEVQVAGFIDGKGPRWHGMAMAALTVQMLASFHVFPSPYRGKKACCCIANNHIVKHLPIQTRCRAAYAIGYVLT